MWQQPAVRRALLESLAKNPEPLRYCPKVGIAETLVKTAPFESMMFPNFPQVRIHVSFSGGYNSCTSGLSILSPESNAFDKKSKKMTTSLFLLRNYSATLVLFWNDLFPSISGHKCVFSTGSKNPQALHEDREVMLEASPDFRRVEKHPPKN